MLMRATVSGIIMLGLGLGCLLAEPGYIEWQGWVDIGGTETFAALNLPARLGQPTHWNHVRRFESARDFRENFLVRMRGWLQPEESGEHRFVLQAQGSAVLRWGADPEGPLETLAEVVDGTVRSRPVTLTAGRRVYVEAIHVGGVGPDSLRVGWIDPRGDEVKTLPATLFEGIASREEIEAFNRRVAYVQAYTRNYDVHTGWARNRHDSHSPHWLVRETAYAAGAFLEDGTDEGLAEAVQMLRRVLGYQNNSERSPSFGNWPRVAQRPGDFNAQNIGGFIGAELILILERHAERLPPDLVTELESALRMAAIRGMRYNPPVTATNIITKAVAVGLLADQRLDLPEVGAWARDRLRALHDHTRETGLGTEYNSPTYNIVVRRALGMVLDLWRDEEHRPLVEDLHRAAWREIAWNYNPHLGLWTGPAARRYWDIDSPAAALQLATDNHLFFGENAYERTSDSVPAELAPYFAPTSDVRSHRFTVLSARPTANIIDQQSPVPLVATLHHDPTFTLGSFNRGDLWDQRRAVIAHWGRRDAPGVFRLATPTGSAGLLAAQVNTIQEANHLVAAVTWVTDAGWGRNPYDLHDSSARALTPMREVRLRLLTAGASGGGVIAAPRSPHDTIRHPFPGGALEIRLLAARFGPNPPRWEATPGGLDLVLDAGRELPISDLSEAAVALAISLLPERPSSNPPLDARWLNGELHLRLGERRLRVPSRPTTYAALQDALLAQPDFSPEPNATIHPPTP